MRIVVADDSYPTQRLGAFAVSQPHVGQTPGAEMLYFLFKFCFFSLLKSAASCQRKSIHHHHVGRFKQTGGCQKRLTL